MGSPNVKSWLEDLLCAKMFFFDTWVSDSDKFTKNDTVNSRYSGHPWDYPMWLEYRDGPISGYLEIPAAIFETVSRASSPACKVIVTG